MTSTRLNASDTGLDPSTNIGTQPCASDSYLSEAKVLYKSFRLESETLYSAAYLDSGSKIPVR